MSHDSSILARLENLERDNRRWRRCAGLLALLVLGTISMALVAPTADEIKAKRFILVDDAGQSLGRWEADSQGHPQLHMIKGKDQVFLTTNNPGVLVRGGDGKRGAFMGIEPNGSVKLQLQSERFIDGMHLIVRPDGSNGLYSHDTKGYARANIQTMADGTSSFGIQDERGRIRAAMGLDESKTAHMVILDEQGQNRVGMLQAPRSVDPAQIVVQDGDGRIRGEMFTNLDGAPGIKLYTTQGDVSFEAP